MPRGACSERAFRLCRRLHRRGQVSARTIARAEHPLAGLSPNGLAGTHVEVMLRDGAGSHGVAVRLHSAAMGLDPRLLELLERSLRAPSLHNSQPWRLRPAGAAVEVRVDEALRLPYADPAGRQLHVSLGVFLSTAAWVARGLGVALSIDTLPGVPAAARLHLGSTTPADAAALAAVASRRTCRLPYARQPLPAECQAALEALSTPGVSLVIVDDPEQLGLLGRLVASGTKRTFASPDFRRELAERLAGEEGSGLQPKAEGVNRLGRWVQAKALELLDLGALQARENEQHLLASAAVLLFVTDADDAAAHVAAGRAFGDAWLTAERFGLAGQPMTAAIESPDERQTLSEALGGGFLQAFLRIGRLEQAAPQQTERRPLASFWD